MSLDNRSWGGLFTGQALPPVLLFTVFITDLYTQLGFAHGILYLPVLVFTMRCQRQSRTYQLVVLLLSLAGITLGYFLGPEPAEGFSGYYVLANRVLSAGGLVFSYWVLKRNLMIQGRFVEAEKNEENQREYLEYFIESMPIQIWSANPEGEIDFVSGRLVEFTGKSQEEILVDWSFLLHPDDRARTIEVWSQSVTTGNPYRIDFRLLRHTVESITDAFFTLDTEFRFTYLNRKAVETFGARAEEYMGQVIWDHCSTGYDSAFARRYREAAETRQKLHFEEYFEPLGQWLEVHVYPSTEGLTVFFSDVTVQRQEKEQLKLLSAAVSRLNDIVLITEAEPFDQPGPATVFVNDAFERRTGYTREEIIGKTPRILQGPKTDRQELDRIRNALEKWEPVRAQLMNYTKAGEEFWLELDIVPLADDSGWFSHWVAVERDITEQKKMQDHLAASQKMESIGQLTGGMSHDFNNLLTVILGNAELLQEELAEDERLASLADLICQAADKGSALTRNLLAFARKQPLVPQVVSAVNLLRDMQPILKASLGERILLELEIAEGLWPVFVDASQLENAILNLAINSRDAMPRGGRVKVLARNYLVAESGNSEDPDLSPGPYIQITFADNGEGMPADLQKRIFEPFFSTKAEGKGSGLGLSTIYGFLKQSEGLVTVYSEPGLGTRFHLYLPCAEGQSDSDRTPETMVSGSDYPGASVLVVEDNPQIRSLAENILSNHGFQVVSTASGDDALKLIEDGLRTDLLFTDVVMPGNLSGPEFAVSSTNE